jgi:hypothetical protein
MWDPFKTFAFSPLCTDVSSQLVQGFDEGLLIASPPNSNATLQNNVEIFDYFGFLNITKLARGAPGLVFNNSGTGAA